ncbi:MAG: peptide ABC transporter substrate-binding protein [Gammaproteobacteria bacterium]
MKWRQVTLSLACTLGLIAGAYAQADTAPQILRSGHSGDADSLDPHLAWAGTAIIVVSDLFEGLLTLGADGRPVAGIAESWDVSADGLRYEFRLRKDLRWSDGTPLSSGDVVYSLRRLANPATRASLGAAQVKAIRNGGAILSGDMPVESLGVSAPSPDRVVIELAHPTPYLLTVLALPAFAPVPERAIRAHGIQWTQPGNLVSNGAFKLDRWIPQEKIVVARNPHFHAVDSVALDQVQYYPLNNLNTGFAKFRAGELETMVNFPPERLDWLRENMPDSLHLSPSLGLYVYVPNHSRPPFDDVRVRRALSLVLDRAIITQRLIRTGDRPAYGVVPPNVSNYFPPLPDLEHNQSFDQRRQTALQLLSEAGYSRTKPLRFELLYHTSEEHKKVAIAAASMWKQIGVTVELVNSERAVVDAAAKNGEFDLVRSAWFPPYADAYGFLNRFESGSPSNTSRYDNEDYNQLVQRANQISDPQARAELLRKAEQALVADQAVIPIFYYVSRRLVSPRVRGWDDSNLTALRPARYLSLADEDKH